MAAGRSAPAEGADKAGWGEVRGEATLALVVIIGCLMNVLADNTSINRPICGAAAQVMVSVLTLPAGRAAGAALSASAPA